MADIRNENDARERLQPHLASDERIEWIGWPDASSYFSGLDALLLPVGALLSGAAVYGEIVALGDDRSTSSFAILLILFVLGLYCLVGRYVYKHITRKQTLYAITSSRVIVLTGNRNVDDMPATGEALAVTFSDKRSHMTVIFGRPETPGYTDRMNVANRRAGWIYQRSVLGQPTFALIDVADVAGLTKALADARHQPLDRIMDV